MTPRNSAVVKPGDAGAAWRKPPLPDPPRKHDMRQYNHYHRAAIGNTIYRHFVRQPDVLVSGEGYLCIDRNQPQSRWRYPDLLIAYGVDPDDISENNGYEIAVVGKPPDLVLEVASPSTGRADYTTKRDDYAAFGVGEYWRFDYSGGRYHDAPLAGDRLVNGQYEPIDLADHRSGKMFGMVSGYSPVLDLYLCWDSGKLRFYDPKTDGFLMAPQELETALAEAQERIRQLEAELER